MAYTTINKSSEYFNTKLYTGNDTTNAITGVGHQPDLVWIKGRDSAYNHQLVDVIRGVNKPIRSNLTAAEATLSDSFNSFDSDGFTLGGDSETDNFNNSGQNYVAWNWLANGAGVSNTDGSKTSTVSANQTSGFSVVKWVGVDGTVGHGLNAVPEMIIVKNTDDATNWFVYHKTLGNSKYLNLNTDSAETTSSGQWNNTSPTSSVFTVGASFNNANYIAYVFAPKKGFSKFGSYTGNGSADGTFVYTGFSPAFVIMKRTDTSDIWSIVDNKQANPYPNPNVQMLVANTNGADNSSVSPFIDILSNGFKLRGTWTGVNASGGTYIYMAFAENPLVGTNNIPATAR
jgi:hypothetical protein